MCGTYRCDASDYAEQSDRAFIHGIPLILRLHRPASPSRLVNNGWEGAKFPTRAVAQKASGAAVARGAVRSQD